MSLDPAPLTRHGDGGMLPMYDMATGFVHATIPEFILDYLEENGTGTFLSDWSSWITFLVGFFVCVIIGVMYVIAMPIAGCSVCGCRTCACCTCTGCCKCCSCCRDHPPAIEDPGDGIKPPTPKLPSTCKQRTCSIFLLIFTCLMFSAVVVNYVALTNMRHEVSPFGFLDDILTGLKDVERFAHTTADQLEAVAVTELEDTAAVVSDELGTAVSGAMTELAGAAETEPALTQLAYFNNNLQELVDNLTDIDTATGNLNALVVTLGGELTTSRGAIGPLLADCITRFALAPCVTANDALSDLVPVADYSSVDDVTPAITAINIEITGPPSIINEINTGINAFLGIATIVDGAIGGDLGIIQTEIDNAVADVTSAVQGTTDVLHDVSLESPMTTVIDLKNPVHLYGNYAVTTLEFLTTMCLFICIFYFTALVFGVIGSATTYKHGANLLLAGTGFTFIIGWLAMLIVVVTYASGGALEGVACRYLLDFDNTANRLASIGGNFLDLPDVISNSSMEELMSGCQQNESIYNVLDPENNENIDFNLTELLDFSQYGFDDTLEAIRATPIPLPTIEIVSPTTATALAGIDTPLQLIDFSTYQVPLSEPNTGIPLPEYASLILVAADALKHIDNDLAQDLIDEADLLDDIEATTIVAMDTERAALQDLVDHTSAFINGTDVDFMVTSLQDAQDFINVNGTLVIDTYINATVDTIEDALSSFLTSAENQVTNEVGRCRAVYDSLTSVIYAPCRYFLHPYQTVWFTYGWFLGINVISLAFVLQMSKMFRVLAESKKIHPFNPTSLNLQSTGPTTDFNYGYPNRYSDTKPKQPTEVSIASETNGQPISPPPPYSTPSRGSPEGGEGYGSSRKTPKTLEDFYISDEHPF